MLVGSGLLAKEFAQEFMKREDVCIYAAGVSNSSCLDPREFAREKHRLKDALSRWKIVDRFVYFGTCSVADSEIADLPYSQHKLAMEALVREHPRSLILRLPQVAGRTPNPHTLLNYLYVRISRSERFQLWRNAKRNIIDVADVSAIASQIIGHADSANAIYNIANPVNYPMAAIVGAMERIVGKSATFDLIDRGAEYQIDISGMMSACENVGIRFDGDYLGRILERYYSRESSLAR